MWALLMQLVGVLPGTESIRPYLLGTQFDAWHGFLRVPADWAPVTRALWVCALYIGLPLAGAYLVFLRRDVAGDVARGPGSTRLTSAATQLGSNCEPAPSSSSRSAAACESGLR